MEKMPLKKIITHSNKNVFIPLLTGIFLALYLGSGAISYQNSVLLPMPQFEKDIPLIVKSIWIYIVLYPIYLVWALYGFKDEVGMNKTMYGFMLLTLISCAFFLLFPVTYPRGFYPLPYQQDISTQIFQMVRAVDKSNNCLPSLHVGICYLFGCGFYRENKTKFWISMGVSTLVAISTLTTKQHYIYDIVLGFILAVGIFYFLDRNTSVEEFDGNERQEQA